MKNILVVDDSALMRRVLCDIINADRRFKVADCANDGLEALELLKKNTYDAVVLDVNMPRMDGITLLKELNRQKIAAKIMMTSTDTTECARITLDALDLGAIDFVHKPANVFRCKGKDFLDEFLMTLEAVANSVTPNPPLKSGDLEETGTLRGVSELFGRKETSAAGKKIVAMASSTGGPKALQSVITGLPGNLKAPVVIVQHMPKGFTKSLAERLNSLSEITVTEAKDGETLEAGHVYISQGGRHMNVDMKCGDKYVIRYSDEPPREGVKPCANYMYESLMKSNFDQIVCVVLTGMGADGTKGIERLKTTKKVHVIAQEKSTCAVYGMPRAIVNAGLADQEVVLDQVAQKIILNVGVN